MRSCGAALPFHSPVTGVTTGRHPIRPRKLAPHEFWKVSRSGLTWPIGHVVTDIFPTKPFRSATDLGTLSRRHRRRVTHPPRTQAETVQRIAGLAGWVGVLADVIPVAHATKTEARSATAPVVVPSRLHRSAGFGSTAALWRQSLWGVRGATQR
jgi:hypothetical protein